MILKSFNQNIKVLHLEPTTNCNAECPQCLRTYSKFTPAELKLEDVKQLFPLEFIQNLNKMFMCGNLGDPAAASDTIEIFKYFRELNPNITLGLNTNGGLRSANWWEKLAKVLNYDTDYVVFSIDGLQDTNHLYRKNVNWNTLMRNVSSFITAGGHAHWDMIVFEHNEHQVDSANQLAIDMNFSWFRAKVSKRHVTHPVVGLNPPKNWNNPVVSTGNISCHAIQEQSIFVDAQGQVYPCCWLGSAMIKVNDFNDISNSWNTNTPHPVCAEVCTKNTLGTSFTNQWQREVPLC